MWATMEGRMRYNRDAYHSQLAALSGSIVREVQQCRFNLWFNTDLRNQFYALRRMGFTRNELQVVRYADGRAQVSPK